MGFTDETVRFGFLTIVAKRSERNISDCLSGFGRKGYNPINQIVGYLLSGDPAYIPRYRDATKFDSPSRTR